jgi:hypothetical protein
MMSDTRLEAVVRNLLMDGLDAGKIARRTGVPAERVQRVIHRLNDRDPAEANRVTHQKHRQERRRGKQR